MHAFWKCFLSCSYLLIIIVDTDPLTTYPSYEQLRQLCVEQWLELGLHFHLSEDQLKKSNLSENPTSAVLIAAKVNNTDLNWKQIVEGLLTILEYKLAESLCLRHGRLSNLCWLSVAILGNKLLYLTMKF